MQCSRLLFQVIWASLIVCVWTETDASSLAGAWDVVYIGQMTVTYDGVSIRGKLAGYDGHGWVNGTSVVWQWAANSPWAGAYRGNASHMGSDGRFWRVTWWGGSFWLRPERKPIERECVLQRLEGASGDETYLDAQRGHCVACDCTPDPWLMWWGDASKLMVLWAFACIVFFVLLRSFNSFNLSKLAEKDPVNSGASDPLDNRAASTMPEYMGALQFPRFLASCHILVMHYKGHWGAWSSWAYTWVPWFFLLSGFVLTLGELRKCGNHGTDKFVFRSLVSFFLDYARSAWRFLSARLISSWPLHAFGMAVRGYFAYPIFFGQPIVACSFPSTSTQSYVATLAMIHAWSPCGQNGPHWNTPSWFLSCLCLYWVLFPAWFAVVVSLYQRTLFPAMALCFVWGMLGQLMCMYHGANVFNNFDRNAYGMRVFLSTHAFTFWNNFFFGMLLARFMFCKGIDADEARHCWLYRFSLKWGASSATCAFLLLFFFYTPWRYYYWFEHGLLLPLHGMQIVGLTGGVDPLARLFAWRSLAMLGNIAYGLYILQAPLWDPIQSWTWEVYWRLPEPVKNIIGNFHNLQLPGLFIICIAAHVCIERPIAKWARRRKSQRIATDEGLQQDPGDRILCSTRRCCLCFRLDVVRTAK